MGHHHGVLSKCLDHQSNLNSSSIARYDVISTGYTRNENCSFLLHCYLTHRKPLTLMRKLPKLFMKAILLTRLIAMLSVGGVRLLKASRRRCRYIGSVWCCSSWLTRSRYPSWKKTANILRLVFCLAFLAESRFP